MPSGSRHDDDPSSFSSQRHRSSRSSRSGNRPSTSSVYGSGSRHGSRVFSDSQDSLTGAGGTTATNNNEGGRRFLGISLGNGSTGSGFFNHSNGSRTSTRRRHRDRDGDRDRDRDRNRDRDRGETTRSEAPRERDTDRSTLRAPSIRSSRSRGPPAAPSASGAAGVYGLGGGMAGSSRFSLTDQFNTTRQEYEFDDADDTSIYYTPDSEAEWGEDDGQDDDNGADWWTADDALETATLNAPVEDTVVLPQIAEDGAGEDEAAAAAHAAVMAEALAQMQQKTPATAPMKAPPRAMGSSKPKGPPLRDAYELFCVPRRYEVELGSVEEYGPATWEEQVRAAFRRLLPLVHPDAQPDAEMKEIAEAYLHDVIRSYEVLMSPGRRVEYDAELVEASLMGDYDSLLESFAAVTAEPGTDDEEEEEEEEDDGAIGNVELLKKLVNEPWTKHTKIPRRKLGGRKEHLVVDGKCQHAAIRQLIHEQGVHTASDLTLRADGRFWKAWDARLPRPLDLALGNAVSVPIPTAPVRNLLFKAIESLPPQADWLREELEIAIITHASGPPNPPPILTISASLHAVLENSPLATLAPLHFALLSSLSPENLMQLATSGIEPGLLISLQQEIKSSIRGLPPTLLSVEVSPLTMPTKSLQVSHAVKFRAMPHPLYLTASATTSMDTVSLPHVAVEVHQPLARRHGGGAGWLHLDSGDWGPSDGEQRISTLFHRLQRYARGGPGGGIEDILSLVLAMPPRAEIGWTGNEIPFLPAAGATPSPASRPVVPCRRVGTLSPAGCQSHHSRYAVTTSLGGLSSFGGSVRYRTPLALPRMQQRFRFFRRVTLETEVVTTTVAGPQVLFRFLLRLSRFSHVGVEVGSGARGTLHLGLHWQRMGQRISLPLLFGAGSTCRTLAKTAFWGIVGGVLGRIAWKGFGLWRLKTKEGEEGDKKRRQRRVTKMMEKERGRILVEDVVEREQERRRGEADLLSAVLAPGTLAVTAVELGGSGKGNASGFVVQSAKFGVWDEVMGSWDGDEEVADVSVAVAALVGREGLRIPRGTKMERLLGFWDPAPGRGKCLVVRFVDGGTEGEVMVRSGEGLVLGQGQGH